MIASGHFQILHFFFEIGIGVTRGHGVESTEVFATGTLRGLALYQILLYCCSRCDRILPVDLNVCYARVDFDWYRKAGAFLEFTFLEAL
jgi:hypothetical protein